MQCLSIKCSNEDEIAKPCNAKQSTIESNESKMLSLPWKSIMIEDNVERLKGTKEKNEERSCLGNEMNGMM